MAREYIITKETQALMDLAVPDPITCLGEHLSEGAIEFADPLTLVSLLEEEQGCTLAFCTDHT